MNNLFYVAAMLSRTPCLAATLAVTFGLLGLEVWFVRAKCRRYSAFESNPQAARATRGPYPPMTATVTAPRLQAQAAERADET